MATDITDMAHAVEPAAVMRLLPDRPRLLALGEPAHGEEPLLEVRNDLFRRLVEQEGYRTIALETDCLRALLVDDYVTSGAGTLDDVMRHGFSHPDLGLGASPANRGLVRWMRAYNEGRPPSGRLRFAGIDGPLEMTGAESPRRPLTALYRYLAAQVDAGLLPCTAETLDRLLGSDDPWADPAAMMDPARSVGRSPEARELRLIADDLAALLDEQAPHLIAATPEDAWSRARLHARTATGLLRYHSWMAATSPARLSRLSALRDAMMAANLLALAERGPTLAHAHNGHLQREQSSMRMGETRLEWWSAGAIVRRHLGDRYAFLATALGTLPHRGAGTPPPDTAEGLLYTLPGDRSVVDPSGLAAALGDPPPAPRVSPYYGYAPLDPAHLPGIDAVVFVRDVRSR